MKRLKHKYIRLAPEQRLHECPYPIVGLTGGIATGKSSVSKIFKDEGFWVICADDLIHRIYDAQETIEFVRNLVPNSIKENIIDFPSLRKAFFSDPKLKKQLETFLYERLPQAFKEALPQNNEYDVIIYDVPLLFEKAMANKFDQVITVATSELLQLERLKERDGSDIDTHQKVIKAQWPLSEKRANSDFVIENDLGLSDLENRVKFFIAEIFD